jgi:dipeptidase E
MKLLLTSGGITNQSIKDALVELLGKPISDCNALACSTASYPMQNGAQMAQNFYNVNGTSSMTNLGWKSLGILELTALPSIEDSVWQDQLKNTDVLLVNGGDPLYLNHWMKTSGVAEFLPTLKNLVYVGLSAGSMIMTPRIGADFVGWQQPSGNDETLGFVDFSIFPHLDHPMLTENTMEAAVKWAAELSNPAYAIDEGTAIRVLDTQVEVISEGNWRKFSI